MKILVTGGNGYIAKYLMALLKEGGHEVFYTTRRDSEKDNTNARFMDLMDDSTIEGVCEGMDVVIHTATMDERKIKEDGKTALLMNAYATRQLYLDAVKQGVGKFIYFSTFHVYGVQSGEIDETTIPTPQIDYAMTHYFAELYLKQLSKGSDCTVDVVRLTNGIGAPLDDVDKWYLVVNDFCKNAYNNQEIVMKSTGVQLRDFVPIKDIIRAVELLINTRATSDYEVYNISSQSTISIRGVGDRVVAIYEDRYKKPCAKNMPEATQAEIDAVAPLFVSSQKLRKLGWEPAYTIDDVIVDIFEYLEGK